MRFAVIFVFGSNLAGRHGAGAALHAAKFYGAEYGIGEGRTGFSYAIPTKDAYLRTRSLAEIKESVDTFIAYAKAHPFLEFQVTRIGCGRAGYSPEDIQPLFADAPKNCIMPDWNENHY